MRRIPDQKRRLAVKKETLRALSDHELRRAAGGSNFAGPDTYGSVGGTMKCGLDISLDC